MEDVRLSDGRWRGWWIQVGHRGSMRMILQFDPRGRVLGKGADDSGPFEVDGQVGPGPRVQLRKHYWAWTVHYEGHWDGISLRGRWVIPPATPFTTGEFELWPEDDELSLEAFTREGELVGSGR